jgi:hypothetical protein
MLETLLRVLLGFRPKPLERIAAFGSSAVEHGAASTALPDARVRVTSTRTDSQINERIFTPPIPVETSRLSSWRCP